MNYTKSRFQQYLTRLGDDAAAEKLHISRRSAQAYRLGDRAPKLSQIPELVQRSNGNISYACFFEAGHD
jgi:hypothetical protein